MKEMKERNLHAINKGNYEKKSCKGNQRISTGSIIRPRQEKFTMKSCDKGKKGHKTKDSFLFLKNNIVCSVNIGMKRRKGSC